MVYWKRRLRIGLSAAALMIGIFGIPGLCQQSNQNGNAATQPAKNTASQNNPFPLAQSQAAAKSTSQGTGQNSSASSQTGSTTPSKAPAPAAQQNPFPEAQSEAAAKATDGTENQPQPEKDASGYSSSNAQLPDADFGQGAVSSHGSQEKMDTFTRDHTLDGRIEDDLNVADLYMKDGNYRGALLRYKDAVQFDPQNDTALFGIAEATCKLNQTNDAMALLKSYTKNYPQGKYALKAEKLIAHPNKCMHNW